jgi:hypothetical protein
MLGLSVQTKSSSMLALPNATPTKCTHAEFSHAPGAD